MRAKGHGDEVGQWAGREVSIKEKSSVLASIVLPFLYSLYTIPYLYTLHPNALSLSPSSPFSRFPHFFFYSSYFIFFFLPTSPLFFSLFFYFIPSHTFLFPLTPNPIHSTLLISIAFSLPRLNKLRLLHTPLFLFFFFAQTPRSSGSSSRELSFTARILSENCFCFHTYILLFISLLKE